MKGLLLAGGSGTRLWPTTAVVNKHLLPCYDRPVIYFPLSTLISLGVTDLCIVCRTRDAVVFCQLLRDLLTALGTELHFAFQDEPAGLADAVLRAEQWIDHQPFWMILGDNLITNWPTLAKADLGCACWTQHVADPRASGVVQTEGNLITRIEEKPAVWFSNLALTGLYAFDLTAVERCRQLKPSARGELEITDLIRSYMADQTAEAYPLFGPWYDLGTSESLLAAAQYVATQTGSIGSPELAALRAGRIDQPAFGQLVSRLPDCSYRTALQKVCRPQPIRIS